MNERKNIYLRVTENELKYFISCGAALIQNVPESSLPTYCGLSRNEIIELSIKLREFADKEGVFKYKNLAKQ